VEVGDIFDEVIEAHGHGEDGDGDEEAVADSAHPGPVWDPVEWHVDCVRRQTALVQPQQPLVDLQCSNRAALVVDERPVRALGTRRHRHGVCADKPTPGLKVLGFFFMVYMLQVKQHATLFRTACICRAGDIFFHEAISRHSCAKLVGVIWTLAQCAYQGAHIKRLGLKFNLQAYNFPKPGSGRSTTRGKSSDHFCMRACGKVELKQTSMGARSMLGIAGCEK